MSANTETCANRDKSECGYNEFRRLRYFHGMLLDEKDFREEQQYHANKRRLLNRMLHGSGVVCGLELRGRKGKKSIQVTPGLALDCSGNEIWVPKDLKIDLASLLPPKNKPKGEPACKPVDEKDSLKTYYIGIRYDERPTNPVSVYLPSGDCEERTCENSRWKEGYCVEVVECCYDTETPGLLTNLCDCEGTGPFDKEKFYDPCGKCPKDPSEIKTQGQTTPNPEDVKKWCECVVLEEAFEKSVPCPECCSCDHPCHVILGQIKVDPESGELETVCMNECRRYVLTGRLVQQLALRIFSGAEDRLQVKVGNADPVNVLNEGEKFADLIYNPLKAVYRWLTYRFQGGDFRFLDCEKKGPAQGGSDLQKKVDELSSQLTFARQDFSARLNLVTKELSDRLDKIQVPPLADNQAPADKDTSKTKKDK